MNTITATNPYDSLGLGLSKSPVKDKSKLGQADFLELMTAQLKHQDPTKPLSNSEFLGQIAQFSTVSGIQELQGSFGQLASAMQSNQILQASSLVGRSVLAPSGQGVLPKEGGLNGAVDLASSTSKLTVGIFNSKGELVRTLELGPQPEGQARFSWDGLTDSGEQAVPGTYFIKTEAIVEGKNQAVDTYVSAKVESVSVAKNGLSLNLGGAGPVELSKIKQIL
ncbi:MAG: flagellar hook assembly protein FlgD [Gammaproteobacteria bacterium]|nr:flagellar hook assembly protein FlgD [Gammaproteobacteria bacterium]